ncbi:hypothetical protein RHMOL_Rhmol11G0149200 [Rhododendron molle]|uniref:Uncharacterized protein n=1 Tax=Rhododendron molle TaxID=49168 RepID=A0ACC0LTD7_RHOML|nr:hypothetical protein RHMOL_Rhmol11G0149200 [Rhododendron molle]
MEVAAAAACGANLRFSSPWIWSDKVEGRSNGFPRISQQCTRRHSTELQRRRSEWVRRGGRVSLTVSNACKGSPQQAPSVQSGNICTSFDSKWLLKNKGEEVTSDLNGRCIFLVGMMGCGKTTVGKVLSEALGYSFVDSDKYVEEAVGGSPVAQIIKQFGESSFRDYESEALMNLSLMSRQVVATGGGAVTLPINWKYMKEGISVYLDVPLDALACRIAAVGTDSRPLLTFESEDAYTKAFMSLFTLLKKRRCSYSNADVTVSLQNIAANLGLEDLLDITPTAIALEVLIQIENFLQRNNGMSIRI